MISRAARAAHAARAVGDALGALLRASRRVRRNPMGALVRPAGGHAATEATPSDVADRVRRVDAALRRAERVLPRRPSCLVRALALAELLARAGVPGSLIRLGVRRDGATMDAHAWVELDGRVIGDDQRVARRFTPLGSVTPTGCS